MDLSEVFRVESTNLAVALASGLEAFAVPEPLTLEEWARAHFYLSAESSYVEQGWTPWPFQRAIMACMSNDDIREVDLMKSARIGYTKMLLADIGYTAHHRRRNQIIWQPTDDDATEFVKTELDPMLRDVAVMQDVFPAYLARHKDNTLQAKKFLGSMCHIKGGKAAKNYRRVSADTARLDELDAFDGDIEKEGDPVTLAAKRIEGATFPKLICGSTPKLKGFSLIEARCQLSDQQYRYAVPCPHCGEYHPIHWGGKGEDHGFKWRDNDPETVRHLCPRCAVLISQGEYLAIWEQGRWQSEDGTTLDHAGIFRNTEGQPITPPAHIAFVDVWTAYSPAASWPNIVRDFLAAFTKTQEGDDSKLKAFFNTTLGRTWEGEIERTDPDELKARAESYPLRKMPKDCLLLLAGADVQGNRIEVQVWGYGLGGQMWSIDHRQFFGNPAQEEVWQELEEFLFGEIYPHASGTEQRIYASAIDSGGHHADAVYAFAHKHRTRRVHSIKGSSSSERSIENGNSKVSYNWRGKREKNGHTLWLVGTNLAKDRLSARLEISQPGPGYVHLSRDHSDEWFRQLASEDRVTHRGQYGTTTRWVANRKRNEVIDMTAYTIWLEERLDLWSLRKRSWWTALEDEVQPHTTDLFAAQETNPSPAPDRIPPTHPSRPTRLEKSILSGWKRGA